MSAPTTARARFHDRLAARPLLADGGMGTLLFSRGIAVRACLDELVVKRPDLVASLHREYAEAGADLIETLTFGANRIRLAGYGLAPQVHAFNRRAAQIAREARDVAGRDVLVAGSIGPLVAPAHDVDRPAARLVRDVFEEQVHGLLEGGVDLFVVETFGDLDHLLIAIDTIRSACDLPVVGEMTFGEELVAVDGTTPERAASVLTEAGVDALGVNCGVGPLACLDALGRMGPSTREVARSIMPSRISPVAMSSMRYSTSSWPKKSAGLSAAAWKPRPKALPYWSATLRRSRAPRSVRGAGSSRINASASACV